MHERIQQLPYMVLKQYKLWSASLNCQYANICFMWFVKFNMYAYSIFSNTNSGNHVNVSQLVILNKNPQALHSLYNKMVQQKNQVEQNHDHSKHTKTKQNGTTMFWGYHEKMKYRNLYKNMRHNTIRIWSCKDIILSKLFNIWFRFEEAKHVSSMEKEALLLWKLGMKSISPGTHLNTPLLQSYIHKVKFLVSICQTHISIGQTLIFQVH